MKRLALVEDNPDNRMLIRCLLEDLDTPHELDEYVDGVEALEGMSARAPDLVLLDISLPGMDGEEVLRRVRSSPLRAVPVIALTAHSMDGDRERFLASGFDGYVAKPIVDEEELFTAIRTCLSRTQSAKAPTA